MESSYATMTLELDTTQFRNNSSPEPQGQEACDNLWGRQLPWTDQPKFNKQRDY